MSDPTDRSRRQWHFDWRLLVFAGFFLPVLLGLGIWQLERAGEKQAQLEQWQQQAVNLSWSQHLAAGHEAGQPVTLSGRYSEDVAGMYATLAMIFAILGLCAYCVLLTAVPERGRQNERAKPAAAAAAAAASSASAAAAPRVPIVPAVRRVFKNRPYTTYLAMKVVPNWNWNLELEFGIE